MLGTICDYGVSEVEFQWLIPDFFASLSPGMDQKHFSPDFRFSGGTWCLNACLGREDETTEGYIGLYLTKKFAGPTVRVAYAFSLKTANGMRENLFDHKSIFKDDDLVEWGEPKAMKIRKLLDEKTELVPSGVLTIICALKLEDLNAVRRIEKFSEDIKKMSLSVDDDSDVILRVKGVEFRLHKNILSARTPVLSAMLKHEMVEKLTGIVSIEDCDVNAFRKFVEYIYSGTVENVTEEDVFGLYKIADKYQLVELKQDCVSSMMSLLSLDTFFDAISLAVKHDETELIKTAFRFFSDRLKEIIKTEKWQVFMKENTAKANELLDKALVNYEKKNK